MNNRHKLLGTVICCNIVLFWAVVSPLRAQIGERLRFKDAAQKSQPLSGSKLSRSKVITIVKPVVKIEVRTKKFKTSNLTVSSEPGAKVLLKSKVRGVKPREEEIAKNNPKDRATVEFEDLTPGNYIVTVSLEGYESQETEVSVPLQKTVGISLDLKPVKYQLNIDTNVPDGEVRFAPAQFEKTNPDGSLKTTETGGYCIVPIKKGKAIINELQKGYYNIDIRPAAVEYQPVLTAINLPTDVLNEKDPESSELEDFRIELGKKISTETFGAAWVGGEWSLPRGWKLQNGTMQTAGLAGIALPGNEQYRYYTNFEMISDVIMTDGNSIGFVLRAENAQNYYSLHISGAKAPEPNLATGYVVKDGKPTLLFSVPITNFARTIKAKQSFRVIIKGNNNTFKIFIEDADTGKSNPVGDMIDRYNNFRKGAIGIIGIESADSVIGTFTVCANSCP